MLECLIIGDSIAVGTAKHRSECAVYAKVGITSEKWNKKYAKKDLTSSTVIISIGSNDYIQVDTQHEIQTMRDRITADNVVWILPARHPTRDMIKAFALLNDDMVITIPNVSKDKTHPTPKGYKKLAELTRKSHSQQEISTCQLSAEYTVSFANCWQDQLTLLPFSYR